MTGPSRAVFINYASEDVGAAERICEALRAAGIDVWFDKSELRGGDAWDQQIRQQIRDCALFVPIISENTDRRSEGYFRLEWKLAVDRSHLIADDAAFLLPVVIDATGDAAARVPERFRQVQWTRLPQGEPTPGFVQRVGRLLVGTIEAPAPIVTSAPIPPPAAVGPLAAIATSAPLPTRRNLLLPALAVVALVVASTGAWLLWRHVGAAPAPVPAVAAPDEKSIAVMPFVDLSERHDQEYFSDGLAEELLDLLAQVPDLKVPARTSSFYFKGRQATIAQIANALGVQNILEGSVRKSGDRVRVTVQLIRAHDGYHVWSKTFDRALKDVFAVQDEIANAVVETLKLKLVPGPGLIGARQTSSLEAHELFLLGRQRYSLATPQTDLEAMDLFRRAIALDPGYAAAYAALAQTIGSHAAISGRAATPAEYEERSQLLERAIELGPNVSDGYAVRSINRMVSTDWAGARADLEKAVALDPQDSRNLRYLSRYYASQGELSKAMESIDRAINLDPLDAFAFEWRASYQAAKGQRGAARADLERALAISPQYEGANADLGFLDAIDGQPAAALKRSASMPDGPQRIAIEAVAHCGLHDGNTTAKLDAWVRTAGTQSLRRAIATYAACGEHDKALGLLERTLTNGSELLGDFTAEMLKYSVDFLPLREEPRFKALLRKLNLPE